MSQIPANTSPDVLEPEFHEPPSWPKVVGIISMAWGVLNVGCLGCGVVGMFMPVLFADQIAQQFNDGMPPAMTRGPSVALIALMVVSVLMAVFLIAAGVVLLMRRYAARMMHLVWAGVTVLLTFGSIAMQMGQQQETREWIRQNPNTKFAQQQAQFGGMGEMIGWGIGLVMGLGYPAFCFVFFGVMKKNREEYSRGLDQLV